MVKEIIKIVLGISKCCLLIAALDIAAGIYGIKAQDAQSQAKHVRNILFECEKRSYMAYVYGMYAAAGLVVMQMLRSWIIASSTQEKDGSISNSPFLTKYIGLLSRVATWLIFIPAVTGLVMGAKSNNSSNIQCGMTHHNFLYYGGLSCFLHAIFSIAYLANCGSMYNINPNLIKLD